MSKNVVPRSFVPWPENDARLEYAKELGLEISGLVNKLLQSDTAKELIEKERQKKLKAFAAPVP